MTELTRKVLCVKNEEILADGVINDICVYVFEYLKNKTKLIEDERGDFFLYFYSRIIKLIQKFEYNGTPFEHYINVHLKFQIKTFLKRSKEKSLSTLVSSNASFVQEVFGLPYHIQDNDPDSIKPSNFTFSDIHRKRLVIALLKTYAHFDDESLLDICDSLCIDFSCITAHIAQIEQLCASRIVRFHKLKERRNLVYSKLFLCQERLRVSYCNEEQNELRRKIKKYKTTLRRLIHEIKAVTIGPSHRELSVILNIPKGTIDSSLYYLKNGNIADEINDKAA